MLAFVRMLPLFLVLNFGKQSRGAVCRFDLGNREAPLKIVFILASPLRPEGLFLKAHIGIACAVNPSRDS